MKRNFKWLWLIMALLVLTACDKNEDELLPVPPAEQNKAVLFNDISGTFYANNAQTGAGIWRYATANESLSFSSPAANKDVIVYQDLLNNNITCYSINTGALLWKHVDPLILLNVSPIIVDDLVYIVFPGLIKGYRLSDGTITKEIQIPDAEWPNSLNYRKGMFIIGTCGGYLYGIGNESARVAPNGSAVQWTYFSNAGCFHGNPAIVNGIIYILSSEGKMSAVSADNGIEIWSRMVNIESPWGFGGSLKYEKGVLFTSGGITSNNKMYAFDAVNGDLKHTYTFPAGHSQSFIGFTAPAIVKDVLYIRSDEGGLLAFNINTEELLWQKNLGVNGIGGRKYLPQIKIDGKTLDQQPISTSSSVVAANEQLFFYFDKTMYASDLNGNIQWQIVADDYMVAPPVVLSDKNKVYRAGNAGIVDY